MYDATGDIGQCGSQFAISVLERFIEVVVANGSPSLTMMIFDQAQRRHPILLPAGKFAEIYVVALGRQQIAPGLGDRGNSRA
jgi:hypothetical protein